MKRRDVRTYLEPLGALLPKAKALKAEADACLAPTLWVWPFIAFLGTRRVSTYVLEVKRRTCAQTLRRILQV
jgi:hypothetical protein